MKIKMTKKAAARLGLLRFALGRGRRRSGRSGGSGSGRSLYGYRRRRRGGY